MYIVKYKSYRTNVCKIFRLFYKKHLLFYFTQLLFQNTHISLSILQDISIKYSFFIIFYYFP